MKKKLSLLLATALVATMVPVSSFAVKVSQSTVKDVEVGDLTEKFSVQLEKETFDVFTSGALQFDVDNGVTFNSVTASGATLVKTDGKQENSLFSEINSVTAPDGKVTFTFDLNFKEAVEGKDVTVKVTDIGGKDTGFAGTYKVAKTVAAASSDVLAMTVADKDKTVSEKGGELSQVTIKNFDKKGVDKLVLEVQNAKLDTTNTKVYVDGQDKSSDFKSNGYVSVTKNTNTVIVKPVVTALDSDLGSVELTATLVDSTMPVKDAKELASRTVVIGEVVDYAVTVKVTEKDKKDIPTIVGGEEKTVTFTIEGTKGSLTKDRKYTITLDGAEFKKGGEPTDSATLKEAKFNEDLDELTFYVANDNVEKVEFDVVIKASATAKDGSAKVTVSSRDMAEDVTLDLAKIEKAYAFDTKVTDIKRGESVTTADITITEREVGQLGTNESIYLVVDGKVSFNELPTVKGTNGIKFDDVKWAKDGKYSVIEIPVTTRSKSEPATVTVSDLAMDMNSTAVHDRTYQVDVYVGSKAQVAKEQGFVDGAKVTKYADLDYAKCVAEYAIRKPQVVFTLGSADYTVNGVKYTLEAPVFTKDDRTMLPVGPLGLALGLDVSYNADTQTATFIDRDTNLIVTIKEGASVLYMNGVAMPMNTSAITVNGRIFVPVSSVTQAFGLPIAWDAATSTVTVN